MQANLIRLSLRIETDEPIHARMGAALGGLVEGEFNEGYALPWKVPKAMIGRRLSGEEAKKLLDQFGQ
jgi:hypothetical protein